MADYPDYTVWYLGRWPACPCLAEWLPVFEAELLRRGVIRESIDIAQLIGGAEASGGTHAKGGAADIWQHDPTTVWVARQMGADATWARTTGSFANNRHTHIVLTGCLHNGPAAYQIAEVRAGGDGLLGDAPDPGPRPLSGRTWREGIAWAKALQEEEEMNDAQASQLAAIGPKLDTIMSTLNKTQRQNAVIREKLARLHRKGSATREDLADLIALVSEEDNHA